MSQKDAARAIVQLASESHGGTLESYVVGPVGIGVLSFDVSFEITAYVSFSYFSKYRSIACCLGFGFPLLKSVVDDALISAGAQLGVMPKYSLSNNCPAILFPLEYFLRSSDTVPYALAGGNFVGWFKKVVYQQIIINSCGWLKGRRQLFEFLSKDQAPFFWLSSGVPRRMAQVVYLARDLGIGPAEILALFPKISCSLDSDGDFTGHDSMELAKLITRHFYPN